METIRTVIADDEKPARSRLLDLTEKESDVQVVGVARDGREAIALIRGQTPDLLFLDIQMPNRNGFEVLGEVGPAEMPVTIFVTAYDKYAIQAFEAHALVPSAPLALDPGAIDAKREAWIGEWTDIVLR